MPKLVLWTVVAGVVLNVLGWLGNNLLLGDAWDAANEGIRAGYAPPWPAGVREAVSLASDFIYAFALVWVVANAAKKTVVSALKAAFVIWLAGAALTYLVLVNAGFLPADIAIKTSLLALATFLVSAPALAVVLR